VYSDGSQTLYINGVASATATVAGVLPINASPFQIGNDQEFGGGTRRFDGLIDEVKIFNRALTPAQMSAAYANENAGNNWDGTARVCPTYAPHHLEIQHASGVGLTCAASTLTIKACVDAACTSLYTSGVSGTLNATGAGMMVNWDDATGGAAGAGFVIPAGSSSVTKNVQVATAGAVTFGISAATPAPTNGVTCNFGNNAPANDNCVFTASTAGFIFSDTTTGSTYTIPAQVSGIATPQLYLRAVQASTTNPAVCTPAIVNSTTAVTMGYTCNDPATCQPGSLATINATSIAPGGTSVSLAFDANGSAPITARYDDVGQITLDASATATPFAGGTAITLGGVSNAIVVAPHHFGFSGVTAAPIKAGNNFAATVTAYNGLATPTATANFGKETAAEGVTLSYSKCQPTGTSAVNGAFSGSAGSFAGGAASAANLNWSEVGNGDLVATLTSGSYLGSGLTATGNTGTGGTVCNGAGNVGPFIPDHFDTVVTGPMSCPSGLSCPLGGLAYSGQAFTANVYARNAAGAITQNYDGTLNTSPNFAKVVTLRAWDALGSEVTENPPSGTGSLTGSSVASTAFNRGSTLLGTPGAPVYTFGTNPTAPTDVYIRATDTDNVTSLRVPANTSIEGGVKVVSGRIKFTNAYGSELLALPITATAQYFTASKWATSITDSVTQFDTRLSTAGGNVQATIVNGPLALGNISVVAPGMVTLANGVTMFRLAAPTVAGSTDLGIVTAPAYLLPSIAGRATFGVHKGPSEIIYMREAY
jgi:MSHA biogenesis protein MshQ